LLGGSGGLGAVTPTGGSPSFYRIIMSILKMIPAVSSIIIELAVQATVTDTAMMIYGKRHPTDTLHV
jgi:hypothetical protein